MIITGAKNLSDGVEEVRKLFVDSPEAKAALERPPSASSSIVEDRSEKRFHELEEQLRSLQEEVRKLRGPTRSP
jgi:TolA-binding protein